MLDDRSIRAALARVGDRLAAGREIEILIVGGAAGVLTGQLPPAWTTSDVDMVHCHLPQDRDAVLDAAAAIAREFALPANWMNDWGGLFGWTLPPGWHERRVPVGEFGRLKIFAVSRIDLLTMKFLAHRDRDADHLAAMVPTAEDLQAVAAMLDLVQPRDADDEHRLAMARDILRYWTPEVR